MSDEIRKPTEQEICDLRDNMRKAGLIGVGKRKGDEAGVRPTHAELVRRGFTVSLAKVQRTLAAVDKRPEKKKPGQAPKAPLITMDDVKLDDERLVSTMAALLDENNSGVALAMRENRVRMALNIVIAERLAAKPELLLLDMKGSAALVDALTKSASLSNSPAVDVHVMHARAKEDDKAELMKDITPAAKTALQNDIAEWRIKRSNGVAPS